MGWVIKDCSTRLRRARNDTEVNSFIITLGRKENKKFKAKNSTILTVREGDVMKKVIVLWVLLSLSGCLSYYSPTNLPNFFIEGETNIIKKSEVSVTAKFLNCNESLKYFDCEICKKRMQIVFVAIANNSENIYRFVKSSVTPESIEANNVSVKCARSILSNGGIFPPAIIRNEKINREIKEDFLSKEIKDSQIKPKEELSGVIFFNQINKSEKVVIPLFNKDTGEKLLFEFSKN